MKLLKILLMVALIITGVIGIVFFFTQKITKPADKFFTLLTEEKFSEAWDMTHPQLKSLINKEDFTDLMKKYKMNTFKSVSWSTRRLKNGAGILYGTCYLTDGTEYIITMNFLPHEDIYKITRVVLPPLN